MAWWKKAILGVAILCVLAATTIFVYYYVRYTRLIDARLSGEVFNHASLIFAAPTEIEVGETISPGEVAARLRKALYAEEEGGSRLGYYTLQDNRLSIYPGPLSYFRTGPEREGPVVIEFRGGKVASIVSLGSPGTLASYHLEPEVITTLFGSERQKRRLVRYQDLPPVLVNAILAAEDKRFFSHHGVDFFRVIGAALRDVQADEPIQGGSTLTMQLARNFFLTPERTLKRKLREVFISFLLEQRLSKEQIIELYANQIYLGQRGGFSIYGVGEAANDYFNKDVGSLTLPEAALLAGMIRGPNIYTPYKYPDRATERRNWVIHQMAEEDFITPQQAEQALKAPLGVAPQNVEANQAPYFVDMVRDELLNHFTERQLLTHSYRVYTTLDLDLQRAASDGSRDALQELDARVKKMRRPRGVAYDPNQPQFALVAIDPHTGEIRALIGGRNYAQSQLNHVLARRQPGSSFKPFVYATALNSGVDGSQPLITPATVLIDEPTTFTYGDQTYAPDNYQHEYYGAVSVRQALMLSLNVATVKLGELVGFEKIRDLAIQAGINRDLRATPALALGAYVATPLEIVGAYTIFANQGVYVQPRFITTVQDSDGHTLYTSPVVTRRVLDPRVAYLMDSLMQSVINNGTGYGVRERGFEAPAAGKTGTSHDGWFVGFTSNVLTAVWVGYDDDRELNLAGASSALPIWTDFMKRAVTTPGYDNPQSFNAPEGVVTATIDTRTNLVASTGASTTREEVFIEGTVPFAGAPGAGLLEPVPAGANQPGGAGGLLERILHGGQPAAPPPSATMAIPLPEGAPPPSDPSQLRPQAPPPGADKPKEGGGIFHKFLSIFKNKNSNSGSSDKPASNDTGNKQPPPQPPPPPREP